MITLRFVRSDDVETHRAGPFEWIQAADGVIQAGPNRHEIAHYTGSTWSVGGRGTTRCIIRSQYGDVRLRASDHAASQSVGESEAIEFVDGSIYAQPERRLLATLDEQKHLWSVAGRVWPALVIETAHDKG